MAIFLIGVTSLQALIDFVFEKSGMAQLPEQRLQEETQEHNLAWTKTPFASKTTPFASLEQSLQATSTPHSEPISLLIFEGLICSLPREIKILLKAVSMSAVLWGLSL
jgi:hypothetical protein